jgi:hypothetical protein
MLPTIRALVMGALLIITTGCASRLDASIAAVNGAQAFLAHANDTLAASHRSARDTAVAAAPDEPAALRLLAEVHARYLRAWQAYDAARFAWLGSAASVRAAQAIEAAGGDHEPRAVSLALLELGAAYEAFRAAALALAVKAPVLP